MNPHIEIIKQTMKTLRQIARQRLENVSPLFDYAKKQEEEQIKMFT